MLRTSHHQSSRAFTIVELLVVITILGILATVAAVNYARVQATVRDEIRVADIDQIKLALAAHKADIGTYPSGQGIVCTDTSRCDTSMVNSALNQALEPYLSNPVADPLQDSSNAYSYYYNFARQCTGVYDAVTVHARQIEAERNANSDKIKAFCGSLGTSGGGLGAGDPETYISVVEYKE